MAHTSILDVVVYDRFGDTAATLESIGDALPDGVAVHVVGDVQAAVAQSAARFILPIVAGTILFEHGLRDLATLAATTQEVVAYTDHASGEGGSNLRSHYKPAWSPDRQRSHDYIGPPVILRTEPLREVGGWPAGDLAVARVDAIWRLTEMGAPVAHLPHVTMLSVDAATPGQHLAATGAHLDRTGFPGVPAAHGDTGCTRIEPRLRHEPLVSIVIPTAGAEAEIDGQRRCLAVEAVRSIRTRSTYANYEIVAVLDAACSFEVATELDAAGARTIQNSQPFNFSGACNLGASYSRGEIVVLLNDDTEVVDKNWLGRLVMHLHDGDVGAVGMKLLYEDGTVQHAGLLGRHGTIRHRYLGCAVDEPGYDRYLHSVVTVSAVTGACLAIRLDDLLTAGGLSLPFPLNYNDVDLCMKLRMLGKRVIVDNQATMRHFESKTRMPAMHPWEDLAARARWERWLRFDPYDSPSFALDGFEEDPVPVEQHLEALRHAMQQPVRVLPSATRPA